MAKIGTKKGGESGDGGVNVVNGGINDVEGSGLYCDFVVKVGLTWWSDEAAKQLEVLVKEKGEWGLSLIFQLLVFNPLLIFFRIINIFFTLFLKIHIFQSSNFNILTHYLPHYPRP